METNVANDVLDPLAMAERLMGEGKEVAIATVMESLGFRPAPHRLASHH